MNHEQKKVENSCLNTLRGLTDLTQQAARPRGTGVSIKLTFPVQIKSRAERNYIYA